MKRAALHNLGCKVNAYETEAMQQLLEENGYEIVPFKEGADVYIINTCTVTNMADRKSRQMLFSYSFPFSLYMFNLPKMLRFSLAIYFLTFVSIHFKIVIEQNKIQGGFF